MIFVSNEDHLDPGVNLAIEEYLLRNLDTEEDVLLFYINEPSIIIGRNQNTLEEINHEYVEKNHIHVVRRLSGGGAVYHDLGNLNFSFISNAGKENVQNFRKFTAPVIEVLQKMGVDAELSGRNDILVGERKISGNAQYSTGKRMYSHGTLLFNSDLSKVGEALNVKMSKISSKGIKSVRSRVANISEFLEKPMTVLEFREMLKNDILGDDANKEYKLTQEDWNGIRELSKNRYKNWDWNFGRSPTFNVQKTNRFPFGEIDVRMDIEKGQIVCIKVYGDFLGHGDVAQIEERLMGTRFEKDDLSRALNDVDVSPIFGGGITNIEFLEFLY
ncbi:MAG: lipoate--protein ligase [Anaerolineales bacterium]|nr:lipoate--protein ligase [Anaerolineales bacterium]